MRTRTMWVVTAASLLCGTLCAEEVNGEGPELKAQTACPVMGGKIDKQQYVDHEGQRIYVCCAGCIAPLRKDPETYIRKLAEKGEKPATLQSTCPVMGGKINRDLFVDHEGQRIYVCCAGCIDAIKADPAKYVEKLHQKGIALHSVPDENAKGGK
ncbi:hypothetical protein ACFLSJ_04360 [Verrucomicrobiota bacterium]